MEDLKKCRDILWNIRTSDLRPLTGKFGCLRVERCITDKRDEHWLLCYYLIYARRSALTIPLPLRWPSSRPSALIHYSFYPFEYTSWVKSAKSFSRTENAEIRAWNGASLEIFEITQEEATKGRKKLQNFFAEGFHGLPTHHSRRSREGVSFPASCLPVTKRGTAETLHRHFNEFLNTGKLQNILLCSRGLEDDVIRK